MCVRAIESQTYWLERSFVCLEFSFKAGFLSMLIRSATASYTQVLKTSKGRVSVTSLSHLLQSCTASWWNSSWWPAQISQDLSRYGVKWKSCWVSVSLNLVQSSGLRLLFQTLQKFTVFHSINLFQLISHHAAIAITFVMRCSESGNIMVSLLCA